MIAPLENLKFKICDDDDGDEERASARVENFI
jgi:hypothetical protein